MNEHPLVPQDEKGAVSQPLPAAQDNPAAVYLASLTSQQSRYTMTNALRTLVSMTTNREVSQVTPQMMLAFPWHRLRYQHTAAMRARLAERYSPANANRIISALRGVLKEAWRLGYMSAEEFQRAADIRNVKATALPSGRSLMVDELQRLADVCRRDPHPAGARDLAMIAMLYSCGLRRSELVQLTREDFNPATGELKVRMGKGRKQRIVYVTGTALSALKRWLAYLPAETRPLFVPIYKGDHIKNWALTSQSIYDILKKRAAQAGVKQFSPHDFRRTFVGDMLDLGVDIATVANIAGHSSIETTRRYDRRGDAAKKKAAEKLQFPDAPLE